MSAYQSLRFVGSDGADLHVRHYPNPGSALTVLCLHGLTRNAADFDELANLLAGRYELLIPDQRGRGLSQWTDRAGYNPGVYAQDMWRLLDHRSLHSVAIIGTSMGGLMAMIMAAQQPDRISGVVLNDVGPEIDPVGLARIKKYVGADIKPVSFALAVARQQQINGAVFPDYDACQWQSFTKKLYRQQPDGLWTLNYDPAIRLAIAESEDNAVPADLWSLFDALTARPLLLVRGETSDILSAGCLARMAQRHPTARTVVVPGRGHAPMLDEPVAAAAVQEFLKTLEV